MGRRYICEDLTGKQFERWSVINQQGTTRNGKMYLCRCTCGNERIIAAANLHWGKTKSCGCLLTIDMAGQRVGKLTVLNLCKDRMVGKGCIWECLCDCGALVYRPTGKLVTAQKTGRVSSCGHHTSQAKHRLGSGKGNYTKEYSLWIHAKVRAKKAGVPFNLSVDDVVIPPVCPLLGIALEPNIRGKRKESSPSLDRKVPSLGYVRGNVWVVSYRANRIKNDATLLELEMLVERWRKSNEIS